MKKDQLEIQHLSLLMLGVFAISWAAPLFKLSQPTPPLIAAGTRLSIAALCWFMIVLIQIKRGQVDIGLFIREQLKIALLCGFCYAVHFGAWVWSLGLTSVIVSASLVTTTPLMLGLIGLVTGHDQPHRRLVIGGGIALIGIFRLSFDSQQDHTVHTSGDLLALLGALAMVPYLLLVRQLGPNLQLAPFSLISTTVGALLLWISAYWSLPSQSLVLPSQSALYALMAAAFVPQLIGHSALSLSLKYFTPTEVGLATLLEPLGASLIAWFLLSEAPSHVALSASLLILFGVALSLKHSVRFDETKEH